MATFSKSAEGSNYVRTTGIAVPSTRISAVRVNIEYDIFSTEGGREESGEMDERTAMYFTTNSSYSSAASSATKLTAANLNNYLGKTIYLLIDPDDFHDNVSALWTVTFNGSITFTLDNSTPEPPIKLGTTAIQTVYLGSLEIGAIYQGSTRIWHRENVSTSTKAATTGMNNGVDYYYDYSGSYTFTSSKPYQVKTNQPLNVHTFSATYNATTGTISYRGAAKSSGAIVTVNMIAYYAG